MKEIINKLCPLCQDESKLYFDYSNIGRDDYRLLICCQCRLAYTDPLPPARFLGEFYQSYDSAGKRDNYYRYLQDFHHSRDGRKFEKLFLKLAKQYNFNKSLSMLDLGSGGGAFLSILKRNGYVGRGLEISREAVEFAKSNFQVDCDVGDALKPSFRTGSMGVVFMWDLLEHLSDQNKIIENINSWLVSGGYLVLETPNSNALINSFVLFLAKMGIKWPAQWLFGFHHLYWHSQNSLKNLLINHGFEIIKITKKNTPAHRIFPLSLKNFFLWATLVRLNNTATIMGRQNKFLIIAQKTNGTK